MTELDLYSHQKTALAKLRNGKILYGGVGTGKTLVAATYYKEREAPRDVYVITTAKKRDSFDWQEEFYRLGIGPRSGPVGPQARSSGRRRQKQQAGEAAFPGPTNEPERLDILDGTDGSSDRDGTRRGGRAGTHDKSIVEGHLGGDGSGSRRVLGECGVYPYVLTVDSWNNIAKYADVAGAFFIFDEQRLVGSGDWTRKFLRIAKHNRWILLSGTPGDTWMDYIPVFVANNFYKNRSEFKREHVVYNTFTKFPKVDRYINVGRLARQRSQLLVEMPFVRHTRRRHVEVPLCYDKETLDRVLKDRWHVYEDRPLRDVGEMCGVSRKVVNSDPSRLEMVCELWKIHPRLIVFYNFNYELESLRLLENASSQPSTSTVAQSSGDRMAPCPTELSSLTDGLDQTSSANLSNPIGPEWNPCETNNSDTSRSLSAQSQEKSGTKSTGTLSLTKNDGRSAGSTVSLAEWNGHKHQPIPQSDRWLYLVQYAAGAEGWNCTETDAMIFYSRNYSWKVYEQAQGRIDRLNTPFSDLWYYDFMTDSWIDKAIGRSLRAKESFQESRYSGLLKG